MKTSVIATLGAGVFAIVLAAYLFAYATTVRDPVEWKTGDLIVQDSKAEETLPLFAADGSGITHIGMIDVTEDNVAVVIEVVDTVQETPIREFIARGKGKNFAVYRIDGLSDEQRMSAVTAARRQLGKPNDFFLRRSWDAFYSSELARLAYSDIGFDLGRLQKLSSVASDLAMVKSQFNRKWSSHKDCEKRHLDNEQCWVLVTKQDVITPANIVKDSQLTKVYSSMEVVAAK
ncbi:MAG: hypothetical protein K8S25_18350 [Alphaproteobacteria bacterium]|nr:hypothetical protein [Alphaproteobacteria bacterium]